jgi:hypothetical protein
MIIVIWFLWKEEEEEEKVTKKEWEISAVYAGSTKKNQKPKNTVDINWKLLDDT